MEKRIPKQIIKEFQKFNTSSISRNKKVLLISAGGKGERIRKYINSTPKHLLPLPSRGNTIIQEIVENALDYFGRIIISVNKNNKLFFEKISYLQSKNILIEVDNILRGPLGPQVRSLLTIRKRIYGCAGDFFCEFSWEKFENFHNSHKNPISILVATSIPMQQGAVFKINNHIVKQWKRVKKTSKNDLINIGAYIIDYTPTTKKYIEAISSHKEDEFFNIFIPKGLISAYNPGVIGFNVNTIETYKKLCSFLSKECPFCLSNKKIKKKEIIIENSLCYVIKSSGQTPKYSVMVIPKRHIFTPLELTTKEWLATKELIYKVKIFLTFCEPKGYNIGWNIGKVAGQNISHLHLHIFPRFYEETLVRKGIRHIFKYQ